MFLFNTVRDTIRYPYIVKDCDKDGGTSSGRITSILSRHVRYTYVIS